MVQYPVSGHSDTDYSPAARRFEVSEPCYTQHGVFYTVTKSWHLYRQHT